MKYAFIHRHRRVWPIETALKPPEYPELGALFVIAGGTGKYTNWTGTFSVRVFVGFDEATSGVGGIVCYDQPWFSISGK